MTGVNARFIDGFLDGQIRVLNCDYLDPPAFLRVSDINRESISPKESIVCQTQVSVKTYTYTLYDNWPLRYTLTKIE